jgi:hypothetical protein
VTILKFYGGNTSNLAEEYEQRKRYLDYLESSGFRLLDTLQEKKHYGFLNSDFQVVYSTANPVDFGPFAPGIETLNYISPMFQSFREDYLGDSQTSQYVRIPSAISSLTPIRGYVNVLEGYQTYKRIVAQKMLGLLDAIPVERLGNYSDFVEEVTSLLFGEDMIGYMVTRSGYLLSSDSDVHHTGLYIDLGRGYSPHLDSEKGKIVQDEGFKCYIEYANKHGFLVDANAPWRIVADLDSTLMQTNIVNNKPRNFKDFFGSVYTTRAARDDFFDMKSFYEALYLGYRRRIGLPDVLIPSILFDRLPLDSIVKTFVTNRFREVGLVGEYISHEPTRGYLRHSQNETVRRYSQSGILGLFGVAGYVESICSQQLQSLLAHNQSTINIPDLYDLTDP